LFEKQSFRKPLKWPYTATLALLLPANYAPDPMGRIKSV
jgi:hypothetical protein